PCWGDDHFGAISTQEPDFVLAHFIRQNEDTAIPPHSTYNSQPQTGVPGSCLNNGATQTQRSRFLGQFNHVECDSVFGASARIERLRLRQNRWRETFDRSFQPYQRSLTNALKNAFTHPLVKAAKK